MASILILGQQGIPLAFLLTTQGHLVKVYEKELTHTLEGYRNPTRIDDPFASVEQYDLIINCNPYYAYLCEDLKDRRPLIGGSSYHSRMETDPAYANKLIKLSSNIQLQASTVITDLPTLHTALAQATPKCLEHSAPSFYFKSTTSDNALLRQLVKVKGNDLLPCTISDNLLEHHLLATGWFNGKEWLGPFLYTLNEYSWFVLDDKLIQATFYQLSAFLEKASYHGPLTLDVACTKEVIFFARCLTSLAHPLHLAFAELIRTPLFDFYYALANGTAPSLEEWYTGKAVSAPLKLTSEQHWIWWDGITLLDIPEPARPHVLLRNTMKRGGKAECFSYNNDSLVGWITSRGTSLRECNRRVMRTFNNITLDPALFTLGTTEEAKEMEVKYQLDEWGWINA
jgi:hypothetical protein